MGSVGVVSNGAALSPQGNYLLARDQRASTRLTFQHFALVQFQGFTFHPTIQSYIDTQTKNNHALHIADLATGNGIWAFEVAKTIPSAEVTGIDISDSQFPPPLSRPKNTAFATGDLFDTDLAERYTSAFDIIHLRLTVGFIYDKSKDTLISNILRMLKPGGYIQWEEVADPAIWTVHSDGSTTEGLPLPFELMFRHAPMLSAMKWARSLPGLFERAGFTDIVEYRPNPTDNVGVLLPQKELLYWVIEEVFELMISLGKPGAREDYEIALEEFQKAYRRGEMWAYGWTIALGRKPL